MGATLQIASQKAAYTLSDRGTYLSLQRNLSLAVLHEGDRAYFNVYHVITLNPGKSPRVNDEGAKAFAAFMVSKEAQELIRTYGVAKFGQPLFVPDAGKTAADIRGE